MKFNYKLTQLLVYFIITIILNMIMAYYFYSWATDDDFSGLPKKDPKMRFDDRLIALFYYNSITLSTLGYGDIVPISSRARIFIGLYVALITAGLVTSVLID